MDSMTKAIERRCAKGEVGAVAGPLDGKAGEPAQSFKEQLLQEVIDRAVEHLSGGRHPPDRLAGVTAAFFSVGAHLTTATKVLAEEPVTGFLIRYDRESGRCALRYGFNMQICR